MEDFGYYLLADYNITVVELNAHWTQYLNDQSRTEYDIYLTDQKLFLRKGTKIWIHLDIDFDDGSDKNFSTKISCRVYD